jgi:hypothetical protein
MNVFISWSGPLSKAFGELLVTWLPDVIQRVKPWLSSQNIDKGSLWPREINEALSTTIGISSVTQQNKQAPWLLFEAGALQKGLTEARVCPLLIDLETKDLEPPLSLFNLTSLDREDMWQLVKSIDAADPDNQLPVARLEKAFDQRWSDFEQQSKAIRKKYQTTAKAPERTEKEMIVEVLEISRAIQRMVARAESEKKIGFLPLSGVNPPNVALDPAAGTLGQWIQTLHPTPESSPDELLEAMRVLGYGRGKGKVMTSIQTELKKRAEEKSSNTGTKADKPEE